MGSLCTVGRSVCCRLLVRVAALDLIRSAFRQVSTNVKGFSVFMQKPNGTDRLIRDRRGRTGKRRGRKHENKQIKFIIIFQRRCR